MAIKYYIIAIILAALGLIIVWHEERKDIERLVMEVTSQSETKEDLAQGPIISAIEIATDDQIISHEQPIMELSAESKEAEIKIIKLEALIAFEHAAKKYYEGDYNQALKEFQPLSEKAFFKDSKAELENIVKLIELQTKTLPIMVFPKEHSIFSKLGSIIKIESNREILKISSEVQEMINNLGKKYSKYEEQKHITQDE